MIVITVLGSVQLLVLGIIGQYLGRMHEQIRGRPLFVVESVVRSAGGQSPAEPQRSSTAEAAVQGRA